MLCWNGSIFFALFKQKDGQLLPYTRRPCLVRLVAYRALNTKAQGKRTYSHTRPKLRDAAQRILCRVELRRSQSQQQNVNGSVMLAVSRKCLSLS